MPFAIPRFRRVVGAVSLIGLGACAVGPDFDTPVNPVPQNVLRTNGATVSSTLTAAPFDAAWWTLFKDPMLSSLEERAAMRNLDLRAAETRIGQSRAQLTMAGAAAFPTVGANASELRERASPNGILKLTGTSSQVSSAAANGGDAFGTSSVTTSSPPYSLWQYGFDASWELDLWGRVRRTREAARASAQAAAFDAEAVRVSIAAEVARAYLQLRGVQSILAIAEKNREVARNSLTLAQHREAQGVATRYDAASAGAQLANIGASIPDLERQRAALMNALALLLDEMPHALDGELAADTGVPAPPDTLPVGLPSDLARRRPDILRAEARLHAATAAIGAAKANFYPSISLAGSLGIQSLAYSNAGNWSSRQFAVGPVLHLPIFQGGQLVGAYDLTKSQEQEAAIDYRRTVLSAWREVDDAVTGYRTEQARDDQLAQAVADDRIAFDTARRRYALGAATFLTVLVAERDLLDGERALAQSRTDVSVAMVKLYKSLGGGWQPAPAHPVEKVATAPGGAQTAF